MASPWDQNPIEVLPSDFRPPKDLPFRKDLRRRTAWVEFVALRALPRRFAWLPATFTSWLWMVGTALAQDEAETAKENSWGLAYVLVLLGLTLGLMVLCRPGKRSSELPD